MFRIFLAILAKKIVADWLSYVLGAVVALIACVVASWVMMALGVLIGTVVLTMGSAVIGAYKETKLRIDRQHDFQAPPDWTP